MGCMPESSSQRPQPPPLPEASAEAPTLPADDDPLFVDPAGFSVLPPSSPTGWRARFPGPGQSYLDYLNTVPRRPQAGSDQLYLLPLNELGTTIVVDAEFAYLVRTPQPQAMAQLVEAFYGLPTTVLKSTALEDLASPKRVHQGHEQYRAQELLAATAPLLPDDAYSMTALMVRDVYFDEAQTYGYGFGQHRDGQAVVSFARLDPVVSGHRANDDIVRRLPLRAFKLLVHEIGHTFGFEHCTEHRCIMNGFADLNELDATPLHLGPSCLRKLLYATRADPLQRYEALALQYDSLTLSDEAMWARARARRLQAAARAPQQDAM